ncbi:MAG: Gfo/Idh/MocA family oxidoreductase [Armatimonadetes bacterium]|nr:Gfo/Idh/MocA family oxidoreductase [Armatimonadota bacterium]
MTTDKIGVGVLGYGKVGEGYHAPMAATVEGFELVAVCDPAEARLTAAQKQYGCAVYRDYEAMLADERVGLVAIGTPPNMHCDQAIAAAQAGKHILVDKPFSMNYDEAKRMVAAATEAGVIITANQNRRWDADYLTVKKVIEEGLLGNVYDRESRWMHFTENWATYGVPEFDSRWRVKRQYGGGMVYDYASHLGDQMLRLVSSPLQSVYADLQSRIWSDEVDDHFRAELRFADKTTAILEASNNARQTLPRWYVVGDRGTLVSQPTGGCDVHVYTDEGESVLEPVQPPANVIYTNIADVLLRGGELAVKPQHILETMRLISMIFRSAQEGEVIYVADMD